MLEGTVVDFDAKLTYQAFCRSAATLIVSHPAYDDSPSGFYQRFPTSQEMLETSGNIRKHQETSGNIRKHQENTDVFTCFDLPCSQIFGEKSSFMIGWSCPTSVCMRRSRLGGRARATVPTSSSMSWRIRSMCLGDFLLAFGGQISKMVYSRMCLTMGDYDGDLSNKI